MCHTHGDLNKLMRLSSGMRSLGGASQLLDSLWIPESGAGGQLVESTQPSRLHAGGLHGYTLRSLPVPQKSPGSTQGEAAGGPLSPLIQHVCPLFVLLRKTAG